MPLSSQSYPVSIARGVRNLVLGRILLKEDADAGDTEVKVGVEFAAPWLKMNLPGSIFFYGYTNDAVVVQPTADDLKAEVEHQENVTISGLTVNAYHVPLSAPLAKSYTTNRGAYIRPQTLPGLYPVWGAPARGTASSGGVRRGAGRETTPPMGKPLMGRDNPCDRPLLPGNGR